MLPARPGCITGDVFKKILCVIEKTTAAVTGRRYSLEHEGSRRSAAYQAPSATS